MSINPKKQSVQSLEDKVKQLNNALNETEIDPTIYRQLMRDVLTEVTALIDSNSSIFSIGSTKELKKTLNLVLEGFLTSPYADNTAERTEAIVLFKEIKQLL